MNKKLKIILFLLPLLLITAQIIFSLNSTNQIRYEELAEGVRDPYWLSQHLIYDGASSEIGWYSQMLLLSKLFGFHLFDFKVYRIAIELISLYCLAYLLNNFLETKKAIIALITLGLSPTLVYFNTFGAEYGLDLQLIPILLTLIFTSKSPKKWLSFLSIAALGLLTMVGWLSYPVFILYLPFLAFMLWKIHPKPSIVSVLTGLLFFALPLVLSIIYIHNRELLFYDPKLGTGLFRGAGSLVFDSDVISKNLTSIITNLFSVADGYHFEFIQTDLSLLFPILSLIAIFMSIKDKQYLFLASLLGLLSILLVLFTLDPASSPGGRRDTALLISLYLLFILALKNVKLKSLPFLLLLLVPLHHLIVYPMNLSSLATSSQYQENQWFANDPQQNLDKLVSQVQQQDLHLKCSGDPNFCRYAEIYAAIELSCDTNHLSCHQVYGYDYNQNQELPLSISLWQDYYLDH